MLTVDATVQAVTAIAVIAITCYLYIRHQYNYWNRRKVPQLPPIFPYGNYHTLFPKGVSLGPITRRYYDAFKKNGHKFGGVYLGLTPNLVIVDPLLTRNIMTSDFEYFMNRGIFHGNGDTVAANLFTQDKEIWKIKRPKLTPVFTTAKLKFYFNTIKKCADELETNLLKYTTDDIDVDIYENMGCYFTDIISSLIFGIEANSFKDPNAFIRKLARELFSLFPLAFKFQLFVVHAYPNVAKMLRFPGIPRDTEKNFGKLILDTMEYRKQNNIYREDLLQLLIELKEAGTVVPYDIIAETFNFFVAGYETASTISSFLLYELAKHKDIQDKVRKEINTVLSKHNGEFSYDVIQELTYLTQATNEASRKYPALSTITRVCVKDYQIPNTDVVIENGTNVLLPVLGYHYNPDYFPDPEKFDPERFADKNVKYPGFLPFGEGPRNCIGERLGLLQVKLGVAVLIKNYECSVSPTTSKEHLEFDENNFTTRMTKKIMLRLKKIEQ
ncbi:unnamed protein product [Phyllotreta striolata]|uniref:Cytochrome P450 n=1 Tax=Phyllotreta striolata TaxID=444603 RepID=A0A9N9TLS0_PHYSR|nr:unnamed protein product [Phyllotreta striolata]